MELGISVTSRYRGLDDRAAVRAVIERARVAADAGLDHLCLGDHHAVGGDAPYVQNVPMIGRILADWPLERSVGLLLLLPLWHPVLAAEQIGTLAAMSDAPFIVQTGIGAGDAQFAAMGASLASRGRVADESIRVIGGLLAGDTVDSAEFGLVGASIRPRPRSGIRWWIGAGPATAAIERAARVGDAWYAAPGIDRSDLERVAGVYRAACARTGTTPSIALRRDVLVGDDHAAAVDAAHAIIDAGYRGLDRQIIAGGVDHVSEQMSSFRSIGVDHIVARTIAVDEPTARRSIELLGEVRLAIRGSD